MERLERHYLREARKAGVRLKVFNRFASGTARSLGGSDAVVVFTDKVSHRAKKEAASGAKARGLPILLCNSSGVCSLRDCLSCLKKHEGGRR